MTSNARVPENVARKIWRDESGQDMAEYVLLAALIAVVLIGVVTGLGTDIRDFFERTTDELP